MELDTHDGKQFKFIKDDTACAFYRIYDNKGRFMGYVGKRTNPYFKKRIGPKEYIHEYWVLYTPDLRIIVGNSRRELLQFLF